METLSAPRFPFWLLGRHRLYIR